jgi:hypothetical protein
MPSRSVRVCDDGTSSAVVSSQRLASRSIIHEDAQRAVDVGDYHALLPGSVAIDVIPEAACVDADGEPLTEDQRGEPRPGGTMCDVGAFEVQP